MEYQRANTDWLAACRYGIGLHWTAQTAPRHGKPLPFQEAVERFDVGRCIAAVEEAGADYFLFTATHALHMLPCPHPLVDEILPGRTCGRDLIGEIADSLRADGKSLIVYYNHSCNHRDDPPWETAVGYHAPSKDRLADNLCGIIRWLGQRYGERVRAWWFDSPYSLDPSGPHNSVSTDMSGFRFPWERYTESAKAGFPGRLVTYNAGVNKAYLYTTHQDYWSGELVNLQTHPTGRYLPNGLQWHGWTPLDNLKWVHKAPDTDAADPLYSDDDLADYLANCVRCHAPMCFNVESFQDGTISPKAVSQLARVGRRLG